MSDIYGDPRCCPAHPNIITCSANGMFDTPCGHCEYLMSLPTEEEMLEEGWILVDGKWWKEGMGEELPSFVSNDNDIPF